MLYDPRSIRPKRDWISVLLEERKTQVGLIALPGSETGVEKVAEGAGVIVRVGPGRAEQLGLKEGDRILVRTYFKHANPIDTDEKWPSGEAKRYFLMAADDVMCDQLDPNIEVGAFSRPAMSAVESVAEDGSVRMR